ncbi:AAA family ATPase [Streptomyces sp. NPDC088801]|uniref:AAA family ATPase n=1 Tax=Streptomyces sp. NPDC088801 TaxID=3365903 RepID=UPI0037F3D265
MKHDEQVELGLAWKRVADEVDAKFAAEKYGSSLDKLDARGRRLDVFLKEPPAADKYDLDKLIPHHGNVTIEAAKKSGKTTFSGNLALSFADGMPFLGVYEVKARSVMGIWDYEMNDDQFRDWFKDVDITHTDMVEVLPLRGANLSLRSPEMQDWAVQWLRDRNVEVWVVDPAHPAMLGFTAKGDPNDAILEFTMTLDQIKDRAGVRNIVMPIHTGLSTEYARGGARWGDWPDAVWTLTKDDDTEVRSLKANGRDVNLRETELAFDPLTRHLTVSGHAGGGGQGVRMTLADALVRWLMDNPGKQPSKRVVAAELHISQENAATAMETAELHGRIVMVRKGKRGDRAWLPEDYRAHIEERNAADAQARKEGHQAPLDAQEDD